MVYSLRKLLNSMTYNIINSICDQKLIVSHYYEKCTTVGGGGGSERAQKSVTYYLNVKREI